MNTNKHHVLVKYLIACHQKTHRQGRPIGVPSMATGRCSCIGWWWFVEGVGWAPVFFVLDHMVSLCGGGENGGSMWVSDEGKRGGTRMHPHQLCSLHVHACVLRPLGQEARPCHRAREVSGATKEELTSQHGLLCALRILCVLWPMVLVACSREEAVKRGGEYWVRKC